MGTGSCAVLVLEGEGEPIMPYIRPIWVRRRVGAPPSDPARDVDAGSLLRSWLNRSSGLPVSGISRMPEIAGVPRMTDVADIALFRYRARQTSRATTCSII